MWSDGSHHRDAGEAEYRADGAPENYPDATSAARAFTALDTDAAVPLAGQLALLARSEAELEAESLVIAHRRERRTRTQGTLDKISSWRSMGDKSDTVDV